MPPPPHPMQPIVLDERGVVRFRANKAVRWMLEQGRQGKRFDLNDLVIGDAATDDDLAQLWQLIGHSVVSYGELDFVSDELCERADEAAERLKAAPSERAPQINEWYCGYAAALGTLHRSFHDPDLVRRIMTADGVTVAKLRAAGASDFDMREIRAAHGRRT
jgi:hypothetical protein